MRKHTLETLTGLALILALAACGDAGASKDAGMKSVGDAMAMASKEGPSDAVKSAQAFTAVAMGTGSKDISNIAVGQTQSGTLSGSDPQLGDGSYYDIWALSVGSTTDVDIRLASSDFDTYMILHAGTPSNIGAQLADNDDGDDGTNSRLNGTLEPGNYVIIANSYSGGSTGSYQLSVLGTSSGGNGGVMGELPAGGTVSGRLASAAPTLDDGSHYNLWQFNGEAGQQVTLTVRSDDFDAYMMLVRGMSLNPDNVLTQDDDGAGGTDSRITYTLPETGTYSVVVNSYSAGSTGAYEVQFQSQTVDWAGAYPGGGDPNGKYAVVVGIDDYPGTSHDLRGPTDDASLIRDALVNRYGFQDRNIVFLRDGEATRLGIANAILRHLGQAGPNGTAVFFYSGHGTHTNENIGITGQYDPESGNDRDEALAVYDGIILDEELNYLFQHIRADHTLIMVDACFSGTVNRGGDNMAKFIPDEDVAALPKPTTFITADLTSDFGFGSGATDFREALANPDRAVFMAASSEDQVSWTVGSWPDRSGPASLWTYYAAKALTDLPLTTTFNDMENWIRQQVNDKVANSQNLETQTAQMIAPKDKANMSIGAFLRAN